MSKRSTILTAALAALVTLAATAGAQDIREALQKARQDRERAEAEAQRATERILADQARLSAVVDSLESRQAALEAELDRLIAGQDDAAERRDRLSEEWSREELSFRELSGNVRVAARDLESLLRGSPLTSAAPTRLDSVAAILREGYFPDLDDISTLATVALDEVERTGQVALRRGDFGGRDGRDTTGEIIHFGRFATAYRTADELGYLLWNPDTQRLVALPEPPEGGVR
ncbi:hypothetical protein GF314_03130, partial [bacterium]|nr:hypothetical protein [bacterium]